MAAPTSLKGNYPTLYKNQRKSAGKKRPKGDKKWKKIKQNARTGILIGNA